MKILAGQVAGRVVFGHLERLRRTAWTDGQEKVRTKLENKRGGLGKRMKVGGEGGEEGRGGNGKEEGKGREERRRWAQLYTGGCNSRRFSDFIASVNGICIVVDTSKRYNARRSSDTSAQTS